MSLSFIPFALLIVPMAEIAVFVVVGGWIGVLPTLALIVVTAIAGSILLRIQGLGLLAQIRREVDQGVMPGRELAHGAMILVAGVLWLTPGFVTDTLGLLLFVPPVRDAVAAFVRRHAEVHVMRQGPGEGGPGPGAGGSTIDLDANDYRSRPDPNSPWQGGRSG